jgi:hypothetical protein
MRLLEADSNTELAVQKDCFSLITLNRKLYEESGSRYKDVYDENNALLSQLLFSELHLKISRIQKESISIDNRELLEFNKSIILTNEDITEGFRLLQIMHKILNNNENHFVNWFVSPTR